MEEDALLSTEQILLLENLTYLSDKGGLEPLVSIGKNKKPNEEFTVGYVVNNIAIEELDDDADCGSCMTGKDWKNLIQAIRKDDTLCSMKIVEVSGDPGKSDEELKQQAQNPDSAQNDREEDGALSVVFVNEKSGEAVVAFRGTVEYEWADNFLGGGTTTAEDGVSTVYQEKALAWYQSLDLKSAGYKTITVTGHSKGGNKAKYITIMDPSVDRCLSFDGQGFSDEFYEKYRRLIARNQGKITNHNVNFDFVNLLLNDVGTTTFYQGFDYGKGKLAEAHCPNTFFEFWEDGTYRMKEAEGQAEAMQTLNFFLNSYLRSLDEEEKVQTLKVIGKLVETIFKKENYKPILKEEETIKVIVNLLEYAAAYSKAHPELGDAVNEIFEVFFLEDAAPLVEGFMWLQQLVLPRLGTAELQAVINLLFKALSSWMTGNNGADLTVASVNCPMEKNRVFDIEKMNSLGSTGKTLMDTGYLACMVWDDAVTRLSELYDSLPSEIRSISLQSALSQISQPLSREEYGTLGNYLCNTISKITEEVPTLDSDAADALDDITINLTASITAIDSLKESIPVKAS